MVLDEDALEAMLRRGRRAEAEDDGPQRAELTDRTEEFEVYERPKAEDTAAQQTTVLEEPAQPQGPMEPDPIPEPDPAPQQLPPAPVHNEPQRTAPLFQPLTPRATGTPAPAAVETAPSPPAAEPEPQAHPATAQDQGDPATTHAPGPAATASRLAGGSGNGCRIGLVWARFNEEITEMMADLAKQRMTRLGAELVAECNVPGVYDLPLTTQRMLERDDIDGVVVLGVVVKGDTDHDQIITQAAANQLAAIACQTGKPIGFGVTGPGMTWKQAEARVVNAKHAVDAVVGQWQVLAKQ